MKQNLIDKSKEISYALRHRPEKYGLTLGADGFVRTDDLLNGINTKHHDANYLTVSDIDAIIAQSDKKRFEFSSDRSLIRAMYGHSVETKVEHKAGTPPSVLYHGTSNRAYAKIRTEGLKPMNRQFVHLSEDVQTAVKVGRRYDAHPVVLEVDTVAMAKDGFTFYVGNDSVWLCDRVPAKYLGIHEEG